LRLNVGHGLGDLLLEAKAKSPPIRSAVLPVEQSRVKNANSARATSETQRIEIGDWKHKTRT
jgi:hypothetical protein